MQCDCRSAYHTHINDMLCQGKVSNPKTFWSFIKSTRCENPGVAPLMKDGILQNDSTIKSNMLNDQFVSVFTDEDATEQARTQQFHPSPSTAKV